MSFLTPAAFALAVLLPVIVAMYLLKLRRTERVISSTYLWRRMVRDIEANAPWQRLRRNLLLLLQLLFLIALILTLARPSIWSEGAGGQAAILILDTSASMSATDVSPSRIQAAKDQARRLAESLPDGARLTVIAAGDRAQVLVASSTDRKQVFQAIENIQPGTGGSDLGVALQLASAIAARQPETEILILSDGKVSLPERTAIRGALRYFPIGLLGDNQAISLLTLQPASAAAAAAGLGGTAFAQVVNYSETPATRRIAFYGDGQVLNAQDVQIPPGGEQAVLFAGVPASARLVEARLQPAAEPSDFLPGDDRALAVQRQAEPVKVVLVSQGNLFLETALALMPGLDAGIARPGEALDELDADLTIFDSYVPVTATLPAGNLLFIAPPRSTEYFTVTGTLQTPLPRPAESGQGQNHPLLSHVSLEGVNILDAVRIPLPEAAQPVILAEASGESPSQAAYPLLFTQEVDGRRIAVLAFDLHHSDLPLQVAFPVLMANWIGWLAPGRGSDIPNQITPGAALAFSPPLTAQGETPAVNITRPDGSLVRLEAQNGLVVFSGTDQLGAYQVDWGAGEPVLFAVNLSSPQESDIEPAATLPLDGIESGQTAGPSGQARREVWRIAAALALALLTIEWLVYHRPTLAFILKRLARSSRPSKPAKPTTSIKKP
jgi:hypothetical protein